ncbi:MAG TPA: DUF3127 domain-containing protein [Bacteroidia bacterium]|jgi:hypothetical protein|nr:DUF3127 domain-containing protein [Bacteroidia bacterium]
MFNITGTLKVKSNEQQVSEKFKKREFVITDNSSQYPQHISFQLTQDKCALIEAYKPGDEIKVFFNLRGREWKSPKDGELKYFNSLEAWKIERVGASSSNSGPVSEPDVTSFSAAEGENDLPF